MQLLEIVLNATYDYSSKIKMHGGQMEKWIFKAKYMW